MLEYLLPSRWNWLSDTSFWESITEEVSNIINETDNLKDINWVKTIWKEVTPNTLRQSFENDGFLVLDYVVASTECDIIV